MSDVYESLFLIALDLLCPKSLFHLSADYHMSVHARSNIIRHTFHLDPAWFTDSRAYAFLMSFHALVYPKMALSQDDQALDKNIDAFLLANQQEMGIGVV